MLEHFRVCPGSDFTAPYYVPPDGGAGSSSTRRDSIASSGTTIGAPECSGVDAATLPMSGGASTSAGRTLSPAAGTSVAGRSTLAMAAAVAAVIPLPSDDDEGCGPVQLRPHQGAGHSQDPKPHGAGCAQTPQSSKPSDGEGSGLVSQPLLSAEGTSEAVLESLLKQRKTLPVMRESAVLWKVWMRRGEVWKVWIKECIHRRRGSAVLWKVSLAAHMCHVCTMPRA